MPAYLLFALLAMVLVGVADLLYKVAASRGVEPANFAVVQSWFFGATSLLIALATGSLRATPSILWGFAAGATVFASIYFFLRSLAVGEAVVCVPIYRVNFLVAGLLGVVFLGEALTARKLAGVASGALAIGLLADFPWRRLLPLRPRARSLPSTRAAEGGVARPGPLSGALGSVLLAMVLMGAAAFFYKLSVRGGTAPPMVIIAQFCVFTVSATLTARLKEGKVAPTPTIWRFAPLSGAVLASGLIALAEGLRTGEASVVVPIAQMSLLVTVLLSSLFLGERLAGKRVVGLLLTLLAIFALAL